MYESIQETSEDWGDVVPGIGHGLGAAAGVGVGVSRLTPASKARRDAQGSGEETAGVVERGTSTSGGGGPAPVIEQISVTQTIDTEVVVDRIREVTDSIDDVERSLDDAYADLEDELEDAIDRIEALESALSR